MRRVILVVVLALVVGFVYWKVRGPAEGDGTQFRMVEVARGDLASVVTSTGTLEPVKTVQVGTQVSGIVDKLMTDYNEPVKAGQVIAQIDTTLLASAVASAEAQLQRAKAELTHAQVEFDRIKPMYEQQLVAESDFNTAQYNLDVAKAGVRLAKVDLERARRNLGYATITSPIDGTVIQRSVDVGQTVQASFSAPELFLIAGDLTKMEIIADVDESDIGQIREGQDARFTVQAYPEDTFTGKVKQARLQSVVDDNVVNYQVVVTVENADHRLLPGMTATVDFIVEEAKDVLSVPNAALRFRPDAEQMQAAFARRRAERVAGAGPDSGRRPQGGGGMGSHAPGGGMPANRGMLWTTGADGSLDVIMVRTGITDGTSTQVEGRDLTADTRIIAGVESKAAAAAKSPFQQNNERRGRPRPGGF